MRIRLNVQREGYAATRLWWPLTAVLERNPNFLFSGLLEEITKVFKLDDGGCGLEEYVAELDGAELLHFMEVKDLLKDGDEVTLRPMSRTELRSRKSSGRHQISHSGRMILDGVAFGRPYTGPSLDRPPAPKRARTSRHVTFSEDGDDDVVGPEQNPLLIEAGAGSIQHNLLDSDEDDDEEGDDDFEPTITPDSDESEDSDEEMDVDVEEQQVPPSWIPNKSNAIAPNDQKVTPSKPTKQTASPSSPPSSSSSASPSPSPSHAKESGNVSDDSSDDSSDNSSDDSSDDEDFAPQQSASSSGSSSSSSSSSGSPSSSDSDSDSDDAPEEVSSKTISKVKAAAAPPIFPTQVVIAIPPPINGIPFQGKTSTQLRNRRRKEAKAHKKLIDQGVLSANSTKLDYQEWLKQNQSSKTSADSVNGFASAEESPKKDTEMLDVETGKKTFVEAPIEAPGEPQPGPAQVEVMPDQATPVKTHSPEVFAVSTEEESLARKPRVNVGAMKRLLFGNLGLRTPKTLDDEKKLRENWVQSQTKNASNKKKGFLQKMVGTEPSHQRFDEAGPSGEIVEESDTTKDSAVLQNSDDWKSKIQLSAVECEEGGGELPIPGFPFDQQQIWGGRNNSNGRKQKGKKGKKRAREDDYYDQYNYEQQLAQEEHGWIADAYDDSLSKGGPGAQLITETRDSTFAPAVSLHDLPELPEDISTLPDLTKPIVQGSIIAFRQLSMNANYMPVMSEFRTAEVLFTEGDDLCVRLAIRDRPKKIYDELTGERMLSKFDMPGADDEEEGEEGVVDVDFRELDQPKLVRAGVLVIENEPRASEGEEAKAAEAEDPIAVDEYLAAKKTSMVIEQQNTDESAEISSIAEDTNIGEVKKADHSVEISEAYILDSSNQPKHIQSSEEANNDKNDNQDQCNFMDDPFTPNMRDRDKSELETTHIIMEDDNPSIAMDVSSQMFIPSQHNGSCGYGHTQSPYTGEDGNPNPVAFPSRSDSLAFNSQAAESAITTSSQRLADADSQADDLDSFTPAEEPAMTVPETLPQLIPVISVQGNVQAPEGTEEHEDDFDVIVGAQLNVDEQLQEPLEDTSRRTVVDGENDETANLNGVEVSSVFSQEIPQGQKSAIDFHSEKNRQNTLLPRRVSQSDGSDEISASANETAKSPKEAVYHSTFSSAENDITYDEPPTVENALLDSDDEFPSLESYEREEAIARQKVKEEHTDDPERLRLELNSFSENTISLPPKATREGTETIGRSASPDDWLQESVKKSRRSSDIKDLLSHTQFVLGHRHIGMDENDDENAFPSTMPERVTTKGGASKWQAVRTKPIASTYKKDLTGSQATTKRKSTLLPKDIEPIDLTTSPPMQPPLLSIIAKKAKAPNVRASSQWAAFRKSVDKVEEPVKVKRAMLVKKRIIKPRMPSPETDTMEERWMATSTQP